MFMITNLFVFSRNRNFNRKENFKEIQTGIQELNKFNTKVTSFDGNLYICETCDTHTRKLKLPGQAVANGLIIGKTPKELDCFNTLELTLISKRLLFKKFVLVPKGQTPKMLGSIVNVSES